MILTAQDLSDVRDSVATAPAQSPATELPKTIWFAAVAAAHLPRIIEPLKFPEDVSAPKAELLLALVLHKSAFLPTATLLDPLVRYPKDEFPIEMLKDPVIHVAGVAPYIADTPNALFSDPVVAFSNVPPPNPALYWLVTNLNDLNPNAVLEFPVTKEHAASHPIAVTWSPVVILAPAHVPTVVFQTPVVVDVPENSPK